jgi:SepF-like predicted cell division protein (DUF552 family)
MAGLLIDLIEDLKKMIKPKRKEEAEVKEEAEHEKIVNVRIESIKSIEEVDRIANFLRDGNILFLRSRITNLEEYKRVVEKLKRVCVAINGDIVGIGENNILVVPSFAKIVR